MSDRTKAVLELVTFILWACVGVAAIWLILALVTVIQTIAYLGAFFTALIAGGI